MEIDQDYDNSTLDECKAERREKEPFNPIFFLEGETTTTRLTAKKIKPQKAVDACPDGKDCLKFNPMIKSVSFTVH